MFDVSSKLLDIEKNIMSGLKDFQKATVNRIDYLFRHGQKRVLVSDEVGLGKTLIARGTVAKLAVLQKENADNLVKVVYICSNAAIAELFPVTIIQRFPKSENKPAIIKTASFPVITLVGQ